MFNQIKFFVMFCFVVVLAVINSEQVYSSELPQEKASISLPNSAQLNLEVQGKLLQKSNSSQNKNIRSKDITTVYEVVEDHKNVGSLNVTIRELDNGDFFIFTQLKNNSSNGYDASISMPISGNVRYNLTDFERTEVQREHHHVYGIDPTTYPVGLLKVREYDQLVTNMMISRNYVSKELVKEYENGEKSVLRELTSENKALNLAMDNSGLTVTLPLHSTGNDLSENWMLVSKEPLFKDKEVLDEWIARTSKQYTEINKWFTAKGPYSKLPWSIEPGTTLGYGRNLVTVQDKKALNHYDATKERYFYDLILNSVANLFIFQGEKEGLWETEYTSTWLQRDYGINAPYVDTRHNENIALFLKHTGELLDIDELKKANIMYADFLVNQVEIGNIIEIPNGGYFVTDYYSPQQTRKTHVSLNHALGEMNFLLETYQQTKKKAYLEVAKNMRLAVENIGEKWLRDNGDVWYQINGDLTFGGTDYPLLTLEDLLKSQKHWEEAGEKRSDMFDLLIRSKTKYLVDSKQEILGHVANALAEQGFEEIIDGYENISKF